MEYYKLLRKIARSFESSTGLEYDDLLQEAVYAYLKAIQTYDPDKARPTTHIWYCVSNHLKNYVRQERDYAYHMEPLSSAKEEKVEANDFMDNLSAYARMLLEEIQRNPDNFLGLGKKDLKNALQVSLRDSGMNFHSFRVGWKDLLLSLK